MTACPHCGTTEQQLDALDRGLVEIGSRVDTFDARLGQILTLVTKATEAAGVSLEPPPGPGGLYLVRGDTA